MGSNKSKQIPQAILNDRSEETIVSLRNGTPITPTVTISCAVGDITSFSAINGAVINAANGNLIYGLGIAQALRRAGGPILDTESAALMAEYAKYNMDKLPAGGATVTGPGNMANYKKIIQAIGPVVSGKKPTPEERFRLQLAYEQVFRVAELYGCDKLVIPFLSSGQFGFDVKMGMQIALLAVLNKLPAHGIREVVFVCNDKGKIEAFKKIAKGGLPLHLQSRKHATHILVNNCDAIRFDILPSIKSRVKKEIDDLFDVTRIVLGINTPASTAINALPNPKSMAIRRRLTPNPPGAAKRMTLGSSVSSSSTNLTRSHDSQISSIISSSPAVSLDAMRKREARARESQEEYEARLADKRERERTRRAERSAEEKERVKEADRKRKAASRNKVKESHEERARMEADRLRERRERAAAEEKEMKLKISQRRYEEENGASDSELGRIRKSLPFPDFPPSTHPINTSPCTTPPPEPVPDLAKKIQQLALLKGVVHERRLLLTNPLKTAGFLNASLQFFRRMRGFFYYAKVASPDSRKGQAFGKFLEFMGMNSDEDGGQDRIHRMHSTAEFREMLFDVLPDLKPEFLSNQQDPCELIYKIIHDLFPESLSSDCSITIGNWTICRDRPCAKQPNFNSAVPINVKITEMNQIVDLEKIYSDEWKIANEEDNEKMHHCESCCPCCVAHQPDDHDYEQCEECGSNDTPCIEAERYSAEMAYTRNYGFKPKVYSVFLFNIVQQDPPRRMEWQLSQNCDLEDMKMMGHRWRAVAMICHGGDPAGGHYSCYTNEYDQWYIHNDHAEPYSIGTYHLYPNEPKEMEGVTAILFEKIDHPPIPWKIWEMGSPAKRTEEMEREDAEFMASEEYQAILKRREERDNENPMIVGYDPRKIFPRPAKPIRSPSSPSEEIFPTPRLTKPTRSPSSPSEEISQTPRLSKPTHSRSSSPEDVFPTPSLKCLLKKQKPHRSSKDDEWIRLKNASGTDCFLNASLQCLRAIHDLPRVLLEDIETRNQADPTKEGVLSLLHQFLSSSGTFYTSDFRTVLREVLTNLPPNFVRSQQDAGEIIIKIFHELFPTNIAKMFSTRREVWKRCRDNVDACKKQPCIDSVKPLVCQITEMNQVIDLEATFSDQCKKSYDNEDAIHHCEFCCKCCISRADDTDHDSDHCGECKANNTSYIEFDKYEYEGELNEVLIVFNIIQHDPQRKLDWALKNCNLQSVNMLGFKWSLKAIVQHQGDAAGGHYRCFTVKDRTDFFLHNDADDPLPCGDFRTFKLPDSSYSYPNNAIDMKGVTVMLFTK